MSKPRNRWRPASARHSQATQMHPIATCSQCGKRAYTSKPSAKKAAQVLYPGQRMRAYSCPGTRWWHLTSQDAATTAEMKDKLAARGEADAA